MKRSEIISIMTIAWQDSLMSLEDNRVSSRMNYVLSELERAGMLPPDNGKEASYIIDYRFKCLKWEPEDG
jgi:hypothetical protein